MKEKYIFTIRFEVDRDMVPGWGHQIKDWIRLATHEFVSQTHYNAEYDVIEAHRESYKYDEGWYVANTTKELA